MGLDEQTEGEPNIYPSETNPLHFLSPEEKSRYDLILKSKVNSLSLLYRESIPKFLALLDSIHADIPAKRNFIFKFIESKFYLGSLEAYKLLFANILDIFQKLKEQKLSYNSTLASLVMDSLVKNLDGLDPSYGYLDKLSRTCVSYAQGSQQEYQLPNSFEDLARPLSSQEACWIGSRILEKIKEGREKIIVNPKTSTIGVTTIQASVKVQKSEIQSEFFGSEQGIEYVRVGHLFFVDASLKKQLPPEINQLPNIIYVTDINQTELSGRLGYYTTNTLASLISSGVEGSVVLDCGSGSGLLSIAAKRLGAKGVILVDYEKDLCSAVSANLIANHLEDNPQMVVLQADLRQPDSILPHINDIGSGGEVTIITNIGSWGDYPVTNVTSYSCIPRINNLQGWIVSKVISGGYSHQKEEEVNDELRILQELGLEKTKLPHDAEVEVYDAAILKELGFDWQLQTTSEGLKVPGMFPHQAVSRVVVK